MKVHRHPSQSQHQRRVRTERKLISRDVFFTQAKSANEKCIYIITKGLYRKGLTYINGLLAKDKFPTIENMLYIETQLYCAIKLRDNVSANLVIQAYNIKAANTFIYPPTFQINDKTSCLQFNESNLSFAILYLFSAYLLMQNKEQASKSVGLNSLYKLHSLVLQSATKNATYKSTEEKDYDTLLGMFPDMSDIANRLFLIKCLLVKAHVSELDFISAQELLSDNKYRCIGTMMLEYKLYLQMEEKDCAKKVQSEIIELIGKQKSNFYSQLLHMIR